MPTSGEQKSSLQGMATKKTQEDAKNKKTPGASAMPTSGELKSSLQGMATKKITGGCKKQEDTWSICSADGR